VKKFLEAIAILACDTSVKFIVTSRPQTNISSSPIFSSGFNRIMRLHNIFEPEMKIDIELYIENAFSMQPLDEAWYTTSDVGLLTDHADGLFIFASTVVAYIRDTESMSDRTARLHTAISTMKTARSRQGP